MVSRNIEYDIESCSDDDDEVPDLIVVDPVVENNDNNHDREQEERNQNDDNNKTEEEVERKRKEVDTEQEEPWVLPPCPVLILSGFLGSGKTTLIRYILKSPDHGKRIAVIENEFGDGLSVESLIARDGVEDNNNNSLQDLIELPNGCVCCTVKDTLVETLEILIKKRNDLDYILIEASGMADPGPIASIFWLDEELESRIKLDGIVTIVDGRHISNQLVETEEAARQIAYADRIVLNKIDLITNDHPHTNTTTNNAANNNTTGDDRIEKVVNEIRKIHPTAPILQTSFSKIPDLDWILDADCFGGSARIEEIEKFRFTNITTATDNNNNNNKNEATYTDPNNNNTAMNTGQHNHTSSITTVSFEVKGSINYKKLNAWLADILWPNQDETDKVLTAMLYNKDDNNNEEEDNNNDEQQQQLISTELRDKSRIIDDDDKEGTKKYLQHRNKSADKTQIQQIYRIKGIVSIRRSIDDDSDGDGDDDTIDIEDGVQILASSNDRYYLDPRRYIVQGVHDLWDIHPASKDLNWDNGDNTTERVSKIVIIGKNLVENSLQDGYESCFDQYFPFGGCFLR